MTKKEFQPVWAAGFMSGTSLDAVDAALILTDGEDILDFGPTAERPFTTAERQGLERATEAARAWNWGGTEPGQAFDLARNILGATHHAAYQMLDSEWSEAGSGVTRRIAPELIGVHGQTVLHRPPSDQRPGATLQLFDPVPFAQRLQCPVVHDFRTADVAAGGQGAPLAPAYHAALLRTLGPGPAVVLNLGGVANITARFSDGQIVAFDTGPANGPIDEWVAGHDRGTRDENGRFAARGLIHEGLLAQLFEHPFFSAPPPKSLDRYDFNASMARGLSFYDGCATLTAFSARAVAAGVARLAETPARVIACGGGRHNPTLMGQLRAVLPCPVLPAEAVGWRGDFLEAEAFAFLAVRSLRGLPLSWPGTTGVPAPQTGGVLTRPRPLTAL